jgi:hypothetical protein
MNTTPSPDIYRWSNYVSLDRWASFWHQVNEVLLLAPTTCLVVGAEAGLVPAILKQQGLTVTSLDIDPALQPDVVGDVRVLPFDDASFDVALCGQVLEHIPWADFSVALEEIARTSNHAVVGLPQWGQWWQFIVRIPKLGRVRGRRLSLGGAIRWLPRTVNANHYWEIGGPGTRLADVRKAIEVSFEIEREYVVAQNPFHRLFVLRSRRSLATAQPQSVD